MKTFVVLAVVCLAVIFLFAACRKEEPVAAEETADPAEQLPDKYKSEEVVPKRDFSEAAKSAEFQQAIKDAAALLGAKPQPFDPQIEEGQVNGGVSFDVPKKKLEKILHQAHLDFLKRGFYLFRYDQNYGIGDKPEQVALLPTADKYEVIAAVETSAPNYELGTAGLILWLKEMEEEQPFILTDIGSDYVEGAFTSPVKKPLELAKRMYVFCPDIIDQGVGDVNALAEELKTGNLYFWWD